MGEVNHPEGTPMGEVNPLRGINQGIPTLRYKPGNTHPEVHPRKEASTLREVYLPCIYASMHTISRCTGPYMLCPTLDCR